ncbi:MAG TPA: hypothetical protein VHW66_19495 [Stellaceae bacterium]|jgi:hypothetical protein|nr:hypothetical protein [Stellaceae bacterium]
MRRTRTLMLALAVLLAAAPARADFKVQMPDAEYGEWEIEPIGSYGVGHNPDASNEQSFVTEFGYGVTPFWHTEMEFETEREPGRNNHLKFVQLTTENQFQFTERGQYWLDPGFFIEYGQVLSKGAPNETTFGPILRKEIGPTINTVNLFIEKDIGGFSSGRPVFSYAVETRIALGTPVEPGIQAYGTPGPFGHFAPVSQQDHRIGPQLFGAFYQFGPGTLKWNGGLLFGLTPAAPRETLRWQAEYEIRF